MRDIIKSGREWYIIIIIRNGPRIKIRIKR